MVDINELSKEILYKINSLRHERLNLDDFIQDLKYNELGTDNEIESALKILLDFDKIEYKVDNVGIYVELKDIWTTIPSGRITRPDWYDPRDTNPYVVPYRSPRDGRTNTTFVVQPSGEFTSVSNMRFYAGGSVTSAWQQNPLLPNPKFNFILDTSSTSIEILETHERIIVRSLNYSRSLYSISGSFRITIPPITFESLEFLIQRSDNNRATFIIKFESEEYKCQIGRIQSNQYNFNHEYTFEFSGSQINDSG